MSIDHAILPPALLQRRAIIYVRQSTQTQVMMNLESQRRQYDLVDAARGYGFADIDVIDDDLGVSASGCAERPGFERLVALLCSGSVGAVFCLEVSRPPATGATGIMCWNSVAWSKRASSTMTASTILAVRMIGCC